MTIDIHFKKIHSKPFPKLMKLKNEPNSIVLFENEHEGLVIHLSTDEHEFQEFSKIKMEDDFSIDDFVDYNEPVTLQNKE